VTQEPAHLDLPPNTDYYLAFSLPWLLAPMLLAARMWRPLPFGPS